MTRRPNNANKSSIKLRRAFSSMSQWALGTDAEVKAAVKAAQSLNGPGFQAKCDAIVHELARLGRVKHEAVDGAVAQVVAAAQAIVAVPPRGPRQVVSFESSLVDALLLVPVTNRDQSRNAAALPPGQCPMGAVAHLAKVVSRPDAQRFADRVRRAFGRALLGSGDPVSSVEDSALAPAFWEPMPATPEPPAPDATVDLGALDPATPTILVTDLDPVYSYNVMPSQSFYDFASTLITPTGAGEGFGGGEDAHRVDVDDFLRDVASLGDQW